MESTQKAREIIHKVLKGNNFMTPYPIGFYEVKNGAAELSEGTGLDGESPMYGVSVVTVIEDVYTHAKELSKPFRDLGEARNYIRSLQ